MTARGGRRIPGVLLLAAAIAAAPASAAAPRPRSASGLRGLDGLVHVYDTILDARFDDVPQALEQACGPAPPEACEVLAATALWWRILLDPESHALDDQFSAAADHAIHDTEAWTDRDPHSAEAFFYRGGAYAVRVQWRVLRDQKLAAARDGKHIQQSLQRALALDPTLEDANFGLGMYSYYADVAPAAAKFLRFLFLLPGGDRTKGLNRMLEARNQGRLLTGEADYQLHLIYLWYEHRPEEAARLLDSLHDRFPGNPLFLSDLARVRDEYEHDITASLRTWRTLLADARQGRVHEPRLAEAEARLAIARELDAIDQTDRAIVQLHALIDLEPRQPYGVLASAWLALGTDEDRLGRRAEAVDAYRSAAATAPAEDPHDVRTQAADRLRRAPDESRTTAYRLALEGWRRLEQHDTAGAVSLLAQSVGLDPRDPVAHYRNGRALEAAARDTAALAQFEIALRDAASCPAPIAAEAYLAAGRMYEHTGQRDRAIAAYDRAKTWFGGAADTRAAASRALARLAR